MKNGFPWILAVLLLAAAGFFFNQSNVKEKEIAQLRLDVAEVGQLRIALEELKINSAQNSETPLSKKERDELIRLRNQIGQLRQEKQQVTTQLQQAQTASERELQKQQAQQAQQLALLEKQKQQLSQEAGENQIIQARNTCINNLRQIDGAKQQWALENRQPADALVVATDIAPYLKNSQVPACPSGGAYTINNVNAAPTCSVQGHVLPQ